MSKAYSKDALTDEDLIRLFQEGTESAFDEIVLRYQDSIFGLCVRVIRNAEDAEDVAQETFVRAFKALASFRGDSSLSTWLYRIAINLCKNRLGSLEFRLKNRSVRLAEDGHDEANDGYAVKVGTDSFSPESLTERKQVYSKIMDAIGSLDVGQQLVVILADMESRSYEEIAEMTGERIGTVRSRLSRAREILKKKLKEVYRYATC